MKRILLLGAMGLVVSLFLPHSAWAFGWKDVLKMHQDGIADSLIVQKVEHSGKSFSLNPRDLHTLKEGGVSDEVISAMLRTEDRNDYEGDYYGYDHPRVHVGLGYGYYGGYWPYHGGYWPYYSGRHYGHYYTPRYYGYRRYSSPNYGTTRPRYYVNPGTSHGHSGSRTRNR